MVLAAADERAKKHTGEIEPRRGSSGSLPRMQPTDRSDPSGPDGREPFEDLSATECALRLEPREAGAESPLLLDVRTDREHRSHRIPGATHLPLQELAARAHELDPDRPTIVYCEHGVRSVHACLYLHSLGFDELVNLRGGIVTWVDALEGESIRREDHGRGEGHGTGDGNAC